MIGGTSRRRKWMFILCHSAKNEPRKRGKGQAPYNPTLLRNALFGSLGCFAYSLRSCSAKASLKGVI
ncbi:MAG: hypothetical protein IIX15_03730 [Clostridia bacterium]|nr:hypothetical protein [Clostridia bacterium]